MLSRLRPRKKQSQNSGTSKSVSRQSVSVNSGPKRKINSCESVSRQSVSVNSGPKRKINSCEQLTSQEPKVKKQRIYYSSVDRNPVPEKKKQNVFTEQSESVQNIHTIPQEQEQLSVDEPSSEQESVQTGRKNRKICSSKQSTHYVSKQCEGKVKSGQITDPDRLFVNIAAFIYDHFIEIGIELGLQDRVLRDELETGEFKMLQGGKKALKMLQLWKDSVNEDECTYSVLSAALEKHGFGDCAHKYCYTNTGGAGVMDNALPEEYTRYLTSIYSSLTTTQTSDDQWPPAYVYKYFRLAMIKEKTIRAGKMDDKFVRMSITGKVDDILNDKGLIEVENIFQVCKAKGRRNVVLFEGGPGCGKSTLSLYIAQKVSKGELFNEFPTPILVRLRDPEIHKAKCIADLLPNGNSEMAKQAARGISANYGSGVLFILDGWDELPLHLHRNSIFHHLIQPTLSQNNTLQECAVIVTCRPTASGDLHPLVSSRVEILGFTPKELNDYFSECLEGDGEAVRALLERIHENPAIAGSCYLPLNASILVHLFKTGNNTLPTTQYGIFSELVLSCIFRHHNERTQHRNLSLDSLEHLPEVVKTPFLYLCQLAYEGIMNDRVIFTGLSADVNTLGLLQGVESFVSRGKSLSYNFIHLTVQELLAGFYIGTQLSASEQVSKFNELFDNPRFSSVFQMYSGITKLKTEGIKDIITRIATKCGVRRPTKEDTTLLLSLLSCLYESQEASLCESVSQHLQVGLYLSEITLTPLDCLCIGYFLSNVCKTTFGKFKVWLAQCCIGDRGCKYLASGLRRCLDTHSRVTTTLSINLYNNHVSDISDLSELLQSDCINALDLSENNISDQGAYIIAEKMKSNTSLKVLSLIICGLTSKGVEYLARALTINNSLEKLECVDAPCDDAIETLAHALTVNQSLKRLHLGNCGITDKNLESLAKSLHQNRSLEELNICNGFEYIPTHDRRFGFGSYGNPNTITEQHVSVLGECLMKNNSLLELVLPLDVKSSRAALEDTINESRKKSGLPLIKVKVDGFTVQWCNNRC